MNRGLLDNGSCSGDAVSTNIRQAMGVLCARLTILKAVQTDARCLHADLNWLQPNSRLYNDAFNSRAKPRCCHYLSDSHLSVACSLEPTLGIGPPNTAMGQPNQPSQEVCTEHLAKDAGSFYIISTHMSHLETILCMSSGNYPAYIWYYINF